MKRVISSVLLFYALPDPRPMGIQALLRSSLNRNLAGKKGPGESSRSLVIRERQKEEQILGLLGRVPKLFPPLVAATTADEEKLGRDFGCLFSPPRQSRGCVRLASRGSFQSSIALASVESNVRSQLLPLSRLFHPSRNKTPQV